MRAQVRTVCVSFYLGLFILSETNGDPAIRLVLFRLVSLFGGFFEGTANTDFGGPSL